ncbi:hypothetical protein EVAR_58446_1 [Eumeta japonica]|uniref:Uncharacterized protein n=1 Tax=Eumeta variegata TaxID=151549 RepID=A0A4C1Z7W7_EUMVA|nr:hypothetical protein EVAR_58446_1 [Eumeta japonica]
MSLQVKCSHSLGCVGDYAKPFVVDVVIESATEVVSNPHCASVGGLWPKEIMSQLDYDSLLKLYEDLAVGTSYETETSRNIFFEMLPHLKSSASALLVKYLVIESKLEHEMKMFTFFFQQSIEDTTLLSLIRKLPFNVANYSEDLLTQMEAFTILAQDFKKDIRYACILSYATLAHYTYTNGGCSADYFGNIVTKYFKMYTGGLPGYQDRLIWLQGLSNLQVGPVHNYLAPKIMNSSTNLHERFLGLWAMISNVAADPSLEAFFCLINALDDEESGVLIVRVEENGESSACARGKRMEQKEVVPAYLKVVRTWRNYRAGRGWQNATGPPPKGAPAQEAASSEIFFLTLYLSSKNASGQCSKSEELDLIKSIPELPDAAPDTSVYSDPEQLEQGTSKNQSEPYFSVNNIASSPYVTDKALRGYREKADSNDPSSLGNFLSSIVELLGKYDPILQELLSKPKGQKT